MFRDRRSLTAVAAVAVLAAWGVSVAFSEPRAPVEGPARQAADEWVRAGTVVETMDASAYTYVRLRADDGTETWIAGPQAPVKVGDKLTVRNGAEMREFKSTSLKRTFPVLFMVGSLGVAGGREAAGLPPHPTPRPVDAPVPVTDAHGHAGGAPHGAAPAVMAPPPGAIARAAGPDGRTVAEIYGDPAGLSGKRVQVRGMVAKATMGILGRNWLHVQDGSGDRGKGTHDLAVTTNDTVSVGDIVLVDGTLALQKNIGEGYQFPVLLEDARATVEPR